MTKSFHTSAVDIHLSGVRELSPELPIHRNFNLLYRILLAKPIPLELFEVFYKCEVNR